MAYTLREIYQDSYRPLNHSWEFDHMYYQSVNKEWESLKRRHLIKASILHFFNGYRYVYSFPEKLNKDVIYVGNKLYLV